MKSLLCPRIDLSILASLPKRPPQTLRRHKQVEALERVVQVTSVDDMSSEELDEFFASLARG